MTTMTPGQGISTSPDTAEVAEWISEPACTLLYRLKDDRRKTCRAWPDRCPSSQRAAEEAARHIPGGVQHDLALSEPFGFGMVRAEGAYPWDSNGNRSIDHLGDQ